MANSTSHILPYPIKQCRFTLEVAFRTSAGTPTDPTTPDTELSSDGGATFADTTEEITTGGSNGAGYITLTSVETNNNVLWLACKSANCVTTLVALYPRVLASVGTGTLSAGSAGGGTLGTLLAYDVTGCFIQTTGGTGGASGSFQARKIVTYNTSTGAFTVAPNWETTPDNTTTYSVLLPEGVTLGMLRALNPATAGRTLVVDSAGLADANTVKLGPTGSGTAQTARDIGASVLLSSGTGTGQLDLTSGVVKGNVTQLLGTAWLTPGTAGTPDVNVKLWNALTTVALPLVPTVAGRTLDVSAGGEAGIDWANVGSPTTTLNLSGTTIGVVTTLTNAPGDSSGTTTLLSRLSATRSGYLDVLQYLPSATAGASGGLLIAGSNAATTFATLTSTGAFTVNGTSDVAQTGDSFARIGSNGAGLTALAPASTALSTAVWTAPPTGFLAATFPTGTIANTTNITAGTITTVSGNVTGSVGSISGITFPTNFGALSITASTGLVDITQTAADKVWSTTARTLTAGTNIILQSGALANVTAWTVAITGNITGNLSGSVGSVTSAITLPTAPTDWISAAAVSAAAVTKIQSGLSTYAGGDTSGTTTLLSRLTATRAGYLDNLNFTYVTPLNAAGTRSALGMAAADLDTQLDAILAAASGGGGGGGGSGAFTIEITVTDGTDPLQNAIIQVNDGVTPFTQTTDVNGNANFSLDAATYTVSVSKSGYTFTPTTRTVTGNQTGTLINDLAMTRLIPTIAPSAPQFCAISGYLRNQRTGDLMPNVNLTATRIPDVMAYSGGFLVGTTVSAASDQNGFVTLEVIQNDQITPAGSQWRIQCNPAEIEFTQAFNDPTFDLASLI